MAKRITTRKVTKAQAAVYLSKAGQFYRTMKKAEACEDWDAVGLNAVHCIISANDALLGTLYGVRPAGSHVNATEPLCQYEQGEHARRAITRFDRIIKKKNIIEYEGRRITAREAGKLSSDAEKFINWVRDRLR